MTPPTFANRQCPEVVLRGLSTAIPAMRAYFERLPKPQVDCGSHTRTVEHRPLIGPLPVRGAHMLGALSGFGVMASPAAGHLLAAHLTGAKLPSYAPCFLLERYQDSEYRRLLEDWGDTGALLGGDQRPQAPTSTYSIKPDILGEVGLPTCAMAPGSPPGWPARSACLSP